MITLPTTLILGAGASQPYGYPTGRKLRDVICHKLNSSQWDEVFRCSGIQERLVNKFKQQLTDSGISSVDAFPEQRPEFLEIGKLCISLALVPLEDESRLKGDWYEYVFNKMQASCGFDEFEKNQISFITFNYDRSLEHYLFTVVKNLYGKSYEECANKLREVSIVHLYGQLRYLPWQTKNSEKSRSYSSDTSERWAIREASESIKIISEDIRDDPEFTRAHELIRKSALIYFLGFGYNDENLKRLNTKSYHKKMDGTAYGLGKAQVAEIQEKWNNIKLAESDYDVIGFLKNHGKLY